VGARFSEAPQARIEHDVRAEGLPWKFRRRAKFPQKFPRAATASGRNDQDGKRGAAIGNQAAFETISNFAFRYNLGVRTNAADLRDGRKSRMDMPAIKTLLCEVRENEVREDGDHHRNDYLFDGATCFRVIYEDDQIIESTSSPVLATAAALSARGHAPDTLFALSDWHGDRVHCVIPIRHAHRGLWA
jgi:hypothetical protein